MERLEKSSVKMKTEEFIVWGFELSQYCLQLGDVKNCADTYAPDAQRKEPSEFLRNHKGLLSFHD